MRRIDGEMARITEPLKQHTRFLITTHMNGDGDAFSSALALRRALVQMGKTSCIVVHDRIPDQRYTFLPDFEEIRWIHDPTGHRHNAEGVVVLDVPNWDRMGDVASVVRSSTCVLNIDHHESNHRFGTYVLVRPEASSTCELVYEMIAALHVPVDPDMATQLYTGILFDTGGFRFSNTSARSLKICGKLIEYGAAPEVIADAVFHRRSYASLKLMGEALNSLTLHFGGQVSSMELNRRIPDGERGPDMDTEGFVERALSMDGVKVAFFLKRQDADHFWASLRSKGEARVGDIARRFGGGGHSKAAGCRIRGTLEKAKAALLEEIRQHLIDLGEQHEGGSTAQEA